MQQTAKRTEFSVPGAKEYDHRGPFRWIMSHVVDYPLLAFGTFFFAIVSNIAFAQAPVLVGRAAEIIFDPAGDANGLVLISLAILAALVISGVSDLVQWLVIETIAQHLETDARHELYVKLLGKSQAFHDRQRVGDVMARATEDTRQLNTMVNPGVFFIYNSVIGIIVPFLFIAQIRFELLLVPAIFIVAYVIALRQYMAELNPVAWRQREQYGKLNAGLEETISGIEVVKASAQEVYERKKFNQNARLFRDYFVRQGNIEARYLPVLLLGAAIGLSFLHGASLFAGGVIKISDLIGFMGLVGLLRFPTFISIFSFSLIQFGMAGAERILQLITAETDLDENKGGYDQTIKGEIVFENVSFGYDSGKPVLQGISFTVQPGQTVAIVGQTGSGKTTMTQLVNRTYDATRGRILIDGKDVREWDLTALRSQISRIEQDVFLFSRSIAENIAFSDASASRERIEHAAKEAQAHDFIQTFTQGYETVIGERGVTLSGGQRQRIALARAFMSDPRILILDDSTSAIDSATEDEIQKAIQRAQEGRTTLLITHRLSQIRWADHIVVMEGGKVVAQGSHDELLRRSPDYRRIFARYDVALPPLETVAGNA
jgi:ATP-binding cassette, subfamily B, bacterial